MLEARGGLLLAIGNEHFRPVPGCSEYRTRLKKGATRCSACGAAV